jgi:hypothetical protein
MKLVKTQLKIVAVSGLIGVLVPFAPAQAYFAHTVSSVAQLQAGHLELVANPLDSTGVMLNSGALSFDRDFAYNRTALSVAGELIVTARSIGQPDLCTALELTVATDDDSATGAVDTLVLGPAKLGTTTQSATLTITLPDSVVDDVPTDTSCVIELSLTAVQAEGALPKEGFFDTQALVWEVVYDKAVNTSSLAALSRSLVTQAAEASPNPISPAPLVNESEVKSVDNEIKEETDEANPDVKTDSNSVTEEEELPEEDTVRNGAEEIPEETTEVEELPVQNTTSEEKNEETEPDGPIESDEEPNEPDVDIMTTDETANQPEDNEVTEEEKAGGDASEADEKLKEPDNEETTSTEIDEAEKQPEADEVTEEAEPAEPTQEPKEPEPAPEPEESVSSNDTDV